MVNKWINCFQSALYPARCLLCGDQGQGSQDICPGCRDDLVENRHPCACCALPLTETRAARCGACSQTAPAFDRIHAPFIYRPPLDHLIAEFKFGGRLVNGRLLAGLLASHMGNSPHQLPECLIPLPLHSKDLRARGFNQSAELARHLARELGVPWDPGLLLKTALTASQHGLNKRDRRKNLYGCFRFDNRHGYRHLALVDDVVTTGATATEAARVMKRAGVPHVEVWAIARTATSTY